MSQNRVYHVVGLMSGSSLDGLDIAYCTIHTANPFTFKILYAETIKYPADLQSLLISAMAESITLNETDIAFGFFCSAAVNSFIYAHQIKNIDFIASHGHTIAHHPEKGYSIQIGNAEIIANQTDLPVIFDFRNDDIKAGGQGAPLVPMCDEVLFSDYNVCLNIGGIANISFVKNRSRVGFDVCSANQLLNHIANEVGNAFDYNGEIAASGNIDKVLLDKLNCDIFLQQRFPKSLDNQYVQNHFICLIDAFHLSPADKLATATEHIAMQIAYVLQSIKKEDTERHLLVTGGGAFNKYLMKRIMHLAEIEILLPDDTIIQYKEALAMALMGVLRWNNMSNFLPSVTGASHAVSGGKIILPEHG